MAIEPVNFEKWTSLRTDSSYLSPTGFLDMFDSINHYPYHIFIVQVLLLTSGNKSLPCQLRGLQGDFACRKKSIRPDTLAGRTYNYTKPDLGGPRSDVRCCRGGWNTKAYPVVDVNGTRSGSFPK